MSDRPDDDFDDLGEAARQLTAGVKAALLDIVVRLTYRLAWAIDRVRHG